MAAPLEAAETRLTDAILAALVRIQRDGGRAKWLTTPAVIEAAPLGMPPQNDLPGVYLHCSDWVEIDSPIGEALHESEATFDVLLVTAKAESAVREQQRLARDVRKAICDGESNIQNALNSPSGSGGSVTIRGVGYTYQYEIAERFGLAVGTYRLKVRYMWQHENP